MAAPGEPLRRKAKLLKPQLVYAFLLLASNLRLLSKKTRPKYTSAFEHLSAEALKRYLPPRAVVHRFHRSARWRNVMSLKTDPAPVVFVPFAFRRSSGEWYKDTAVTSILIDRVRILGLLGEAVRRVGSLPLDEVADTVKPRVRIA